ncbi:MAG: lamin tail domain-containing protein [Bacteroidales bacterium]|nr:lamin tail domain-containing protein [Bacteroidales bacterium]
MKKFFAIAALILPMFLSSCLKDETWGGASISNIKNTTAYTEQDQVTVTATVSALVPLKSVTLYYNAGQGAKSVEMAKTSGDNYSGIIPAMAKDVKVTYYIEAKTDSQTAVSAEQSYTVGAVSIDYSGLRLNELNGNDKFIEIYNAGADIPSLLGVYIEKDGKSVWTADNRPLKKGEYLLLYSEDVVVGGGAQEGYDEALVFHSGLSAKKAVRVQLFSPSAASLSDFNLITSVTAAKASYSRNKDGKWYHAEATPGKENAEGTEAVEGLEGGDPVTPGSVILSELNGNDKFIELANPGDVDFDISGYTIQKDGTETWVAAKGMVVPKRGYLLLYSEDVVAGGAAHEGYDETLVFHSGLSAKKAVKIELFDNGGASVEAFNLVNCVKTAPASYSKGKDGKWYHAEATPGTENKDSEEPVEGLE